MGAVAQAVIAVADRAGQRCGYGQGAAQGVIGPTGRAHGIGHHGAAASGIIGEAYVCRAGRVVNGGAPAQPIVGEGGGRAVGVQLSDPQANRIVRVNGGVGQRVGDAHLAVEIIVSKLRDIALGVGLRQPVAARVIGELGADVLVGGAIPNAELG